MDRHSARWRRRAKNRCEHKFADQRVQLGRARLRLSARWW